jgi:hypothetical protein
MDQKRGKTTEIKDKSQRKGQVTLFVILGLIVLIIVVVALFLINQSKKQQPPEEVYSQTYEARLAPIQNDVTFCLNKLRTEAVQKIGAGGGYLDSDPKMYLYNLPSENANNALEMFPGSGLVLPYWYHIQSPPSCTSCLVKQGIPALKGGINSIQGRIQLYIESGLVSCVNNFSAHRADLEIMYGSPSAYVEFREESVFLGLNWSINVTFPDKTKSENLKRYSTTLDVPLKKMYEFAVSILFQTEMLKDSQNFESFTKDILTIYSFGAAKADIPPISGPTTFEISAPKFWLLHDVKSTLKNAISENIPYMQVYGTKDSYLFNDNDELGWNTYSKYNNIVYYNDSFKSQVRVRFNYYPIWPMYVSVGPSHSEVIMPESLSMDLWLFKIGTTKYRFNYDVAYPVLVTLEDDSAFGGKGFLFQYPFEVNLRKTNPYTNDTIDLNNMIQLPRESVKLGFEQRTVNVTLNVLDGYNSLPLEGVIVKYTCLDQDYIVGVSEMEGGNALIKTQLPPCLGGAFKTGDPLYAESTVPLNVDLDEPIVLDYPVYAAKSIELKLRKRLFIPTAPSVDPGGVVDRMWALAGGEGYTTSMLPDENYMLIMTEVRDDGSQGNMVLLSSANNKSNSTNISLVPGKYSVQLIDTMKFCNATCTRTNWTIQGRTIEEDDNEITLDPVVFNDTLYLGGINMDNTTTGYLVITPNDLKKSSMILYYASYDPTLLTYIEDLNVMGKVQEAATKYPGNFTPEFE